MSFIVVIMTAPTKQEAVKIVRALLEERLIACANILDSMYSLFWWKGKIEKENEVLVLMKSQKTLFKKLSKRVTELHSYDVPEILALPIVEGSKSYLDWMKARTSFSSSIFPCHQNKEEIESKMLAQAINLSSSRVRTIFTASPLWGAVIITIKNDIGSPTQTIAKCYFNQYKTF